MNMIMINCPSDRLGHEWFEEILPHSSQTLRSNSVSVAREIPKFPRPTQQLPEANVPPLTFIPEGKENYSASVSPSNTRVSPSDVNSCRSELWKSTSIVRGFSPSHVSSSFRSQFSPILRQAITPPKSSPPKKRLGVFTLGGSFEEDGGSFIERMTARSTQDDASDTGLARPEARVMSRMVCSSDQDSLRTVQHPKNQRSWDKDVIENDNEGSMSASEADDDIEWEDSDFESDRSSDDEHRRFFQRVDSLPNLVSRQSMLTMMINNPERVQGNAFRSSSVPKGSCPISAKNMSISTLPLENDQGISTIDGPNVPRSKPVIVKPSRSPSPSRLHSPRTIRRKLLATELSNSDRRNLLWERQQNDPTMNACLKRRGTVHDMKAFQRPESKDSQHKIPPIQPGDHKESNVSSQTNGIDHPNVGSWTKYATDFGPWEYHAKGW
ncbi:hypothetical protein N7478_010529 [Penicillium angulare]|uniref:uncharacterized protein n=1 Tax=Penicillium angulare TaxID=116970 RepID=UPI002540FA18|nr:uncharacterized protein N7478_010140 [Penicillium angulare]XP_056776113.1 uncharacterized protein N7478_010529 [Penicillium angulare]KAJ5267332.1 hypothetical protein N7478_010140 [Penicillium angulare]KAJ5267721.1 hypothetical protein N7478_010529 [Penicillium angulare]